MHHGATLDALMTVCFVLILTLLSALGSSSLGLVTSWRNHGNRAHGARRRVVTAAAARFDTSVGACSDDWRKALEGALEGVSPGADLAVLFVPQVHAGALDDACATTFRELGDHTTLVGVVGAGVIGGGEERMGDSSFALWAGVLPPDTALLPFVVERDGQ